MMLNHLIWRHSSHCRGLHTTALRLASASAAQSSNAGDFLLERLTGRSLIRVHGDQSQEFLQSLITNDMQHLQPDSTATTTPTTAIYAMFLNKPGRIMYDAIVYKPRADTETYLIECDRNIDTELQKHMKIFRVRKKIDIDLVSKELAVWVAFNPATAHDENAARTLQLDAATMARLTVATADPRLKHLGTRIIAGADVAASDLIPSGLANVCEPDNSALADDAHQLHRYRLGIGEGPDELPIAKCFPLESNADYLHGVSFHKGCYLGQEFTARTHHTGVVRKRLLPVQFTYGRLTAKSSRHVESTNGVVLGKVRGFCADRGLALLKYDAALAEDVPLEFGGADEEVKGRAARPVWWPQEAPVLKK